MEIFINKINQDKYYETLFIVRWMKLCPIILGNALYEKKTCQLHQCALARLLIIFTLRRMMKL